MLKVTSQTTIATEPTKCPFDNPTMRQDFKTFSLVRTTNNFQFPTKRLAYFFNNTGIGSIGPQELQATPAIMNTAFDVRKQLLQHLVAAAGVLEAGTVNQNDEK